MYAYSPPVSPRPHGDPQLVADPSKLVYDEEMGYGGASGGYGAVNPNIYATGSSAYPTPTPHPGVMREQYCLCAPQTRAERRLLITVIVLAVVCVLLLAALCSVLPTLLCNGDCKDGKGNGGNLIDLLPLMGNSLQTATA